MMDQSTVWMTESMESRSLDQQRAEFATRRYLATPLAGLIAWSIIGIAGLTLPPFPTVITLFVATGSIVYLALFISKLTGENFLDRSRPKNAFDRLFFYTVASSLVVFGIAIPFFLIDYTSLPLTVGILTGLMWLPLSWIIEHWIGIVHLAARTVGIIVLWYVWPEGRFIGIPFLIVAVYIFTIVVLETRWRSRQRVKAALAG